ncbi:hypothetical protein ACQ4PT_031397 [Festuca glaucescens]
MRFRFVCSHWRTSTATPRDATLADRRFHPRGWVALCDGNGVRPVEDAAITFFHTATSRFFRLSLPVLQGHRIVGITDGLLILLDTRAAVIRVVDPFTGVVVELPQLATFVHCVFSKQKSVTMDSIVWMNATVCVASPSSIAVVIWFPNMPIRWLPKYQRSLVTLSAASTSLWSPWEQCLLPSCTELPGTLTNP